MEMAIMATGCESGIDRFRSPMRKLVRFFEKSRDNWKRKCQQAKERIKLMGNQLRAVEKSREQWRLRAERLQQQVRQLQEELAELKRAACGQ